MSWTREQAKARNQNKGKCKKDGDGDGDGDRIDDEEAMWLGNLRVK